MLQVVGWLQLKEVTMDRAHYPSDVTDRQWEILAPLLARPHPGYGRPRKYQLREIVNALLYLVKNGCTWRALPHDLPPWEDVYDHFRRWKKDGTLERLHDALRTEVRLRAGRTATPSLLILDSQSVPTTEKGGLEATMRARKSKGASVSSSSIPLASSGQ
jgi:transposase